MAQSRFFFVFALSLYINSISPISGLCSKAYQTCYDEGEVCVAQTAKVIYPDPDTGFTTEGMILQHDYGCKTETYCKFSQTWGVECVQIYIPDFFIDAPFWDDLNKRCSSVYLPITINETLSCCQDSFDCVDVFNGMREEEGIYVSEHCVEQTQVTERFLGPVGCYATKEFLKYIKCNATNYHNQCPFFFFRTLETYAKCACLELAVWNDDSYKYFREMTRQIEGIFAAFRVEKEKCPEWKFSCNSEGEAQLDVFEIVCPLQQYDDTDFDKLKQEVDEGVSSLTETQVEIFGDVIRVLMYSEEEAMIALDWLELNQTDTTPDEIAGGCDMEQTLWNLNEIYGDYIPPTTPAPTDVAHKHKMNILFLIFLMLLCSCFV